MNPLAPGLDQPFPTGSPPTPHSSPHSTLHSSLIDTLSTVVAVLSPAGLILDCNCAALSLAAHTLDELLGQPFSEAFSTVPDASSNLGSAISRAASGEFVQFDLALGTKLQTVFRFQIRPISGANGQPLTLLVEGRDITAETTRDQESTEHLQAAESDRNRLRDLLAHTPAGIGLTSGPEHRWIFINDDCVRLNGRLSADEFVGKTVREATPELEPQGFITLLDQVYRTGRPYFGSEVKACVNRSARGMLAEGYFDFLYQPMRNPAGQVEGIFVYAVEVTNIVAARQAIEENAERLRLAQSAAQIGVWEWDPIHDIQRLSPELHRIFGLDSDDPNPVARWAARVYPADMARVQMLMNEGHRLGSMEMEYRYLHPDMGLRWLYCKGLRRTSETCMVGVVQDITSRKNAEIAAQRLAAIVESSDDAIVSKDLNGIVTSWNPGAERIFGFSADEMIGQPITKIIPPELYDDETRILSTVARGRRIEHFETVRLKKNGESIEVSVTVSPVKDQAGCIIGAAKIARDITQQRKAERALRTSERLASVGRLAATVAHEINNPLEAVTNLIYLAKNAENPAPYLAMAEEELERVSHLTKQTLGFYRETKTASPVRLGKLVESLLSVYTSRMRNKGIELISQIKTDAEINAVPGEIRQVIANLVSNSIDAVPSGGRIRIRVYQATHCKDQSIQGVRLTIADTGTGIPAEVRDHLFEPFFTTKKEVGTGLGLWICKSIIENHRGVIRVRSLTTPGRSGTVFSIFLPLDSSAPALALQPPPPAGVSA